jgi:hypothetical protein
MKESNIPEFLLRKFRIIYNSSKGYYYSYRSDKLAKILLERFSFTPFKSALIGFLITLIFYFLAFIIHLITKQDVAGLGINELYIDFFYDVLLMCIVFYYYIWISINAQKIFLDIQLIEYENQEFNNRIDYIVTNHINHPIIPFIAVIITLLLVALIEYTSFTEEKIMWGTEDANFLLFRIVKVPFVWGIGYYMIIVVFLKQIITVWEIRDLGKKFRLLDHSDNKIKEKLLSIISKYTSTFSYLICICGLGYLYLISRGLIFSYLDKDIIVINSAVIYVILSGYFYFFPLHPFLDKIYNHIKEREFDEIQSYLRVIYVPSSSFLFAFMIPIFWYIFSS